MLFISSKIIVSSLLDIYIYLLVFIFHKAAHFSFFIITHRTACCELLAGCLSEFGKGY